MELRLEQNESRWVKDGTCHAGGAALGAQALPWERRSLDKRYSSGISPCLSLVQSPAAFVECPSSVSRIPERGGWTPIQLY